MYTKQEIIIKSFKQGESLRKISRDLNISRKTVKKYIESYEYQLNESESAESAQVAYFSDPPIYNTTNRSKVKLTHDVIRFIDSLLELNEKKRENGLRKQLLKKKDILQELHRHGFEIGYTSVCNYISSKSLSQRTREAFIKQVYTPGSVCEFDWGEIKLFIAGKQVRFQLAVFTSAYSNYRLAYIYHRQDTLSFMESHVRFFTDTGGVYSQMVYDNMRVAVARFIG